MNLPPEHLLQGVLPDCGPRTRSTVMAIIVTVSVEWDVPVDAIMSQRRHARVSEARQVAMTLIREITKITLMEIGRVFDRNFGTVIHAVRTVEALYDIDMIVRARIDNVRRQVCS